MYLHFTCPAWNHAAFGRAVSASHAWPGLFRAPTPLLRAASAVPKRACTSRFELASDRFRTVRQVAYVKFLTAATSAWTAWFYGIQVRAGEGQVYRSPAG